MPLSVTRSSTVFWIIMELTAYQGSIARCPAALAVPVTGSILKPRHPPVSKLFPSMSDKKLLEQCDHGEASSGSTSFGMPGSTTF